MKKVIALTTILLFALSLLFIAGCDVGFDEEAYQKSLERTITVTVNDPTLGTVAGGGVYKRGDSITLTATANEGCRFLKWQDGNTDATRYVSVLNDESYVATFERIPEPTRMTVYVRSSFYWGETDLFDPTAEVTVTYDNGLSETVTVGELEISGVSTDFVGGANMTISYNGFEYVNRYYVHYEDVDVSNVTIKKDYLITEDIVATGYVIAKGQNGKKVNIELTDSKIELDNFDSSDVTVKDGKIFEKQVVLKVNGYQKSYFRFPYTVTYMHDGDTFSKELVEGIYTVTVEDFRVNVNGTFEMLLTKYKAGNLTLSDPVYDSATYGFTWEKDVADNAKLNLYYQKNGLAKKKHIGFYNAEYSNLLLYKEIFDDGLIKIEFANHLEFNF